MDICFSRLRRFLEIMDFIEVIVEAVDVLRSNLPNQEQDTAVETLYNNLKYLNSVTLSWHAEKCTLATVRYIFEEVIKEFPSMESRFSSMESIVHKTNF